jgi:hypothetical protein
LRQEAGHKRGAAGGGVSRKPPERGTVAAADRAPGQRAGLDSGSNP